MARFRITIAIQASAGFWLVTLGWVVPLGSAAAQSAPGAPAQAKQQNTIASGSATLPSTDAAVERAAKEMAGAARDPGNYAFSVFGTPGPHATWGWRFEGHHLSMTFTIVDGRAVAGPVFFGTNPATVLDGPRKGLRVLAVEEDLGRELIKSLT